MDEWEALFQARGQPAFDGSIRSFGRRTMKDPRRSVRREGQSGMPTPLPYCPPPIDDWTDEQDEQSSADAVAKRMTDPVIEAIRKEIAKIDLTPYNKEPC